MSPAFRGREPRFLEVMGSRRASKVQPDESPLRAISAEEGRDSLSRNPVKEGDSAP